MGNPSSAARRFTSISAALISSPKVQEPAGFIRLSLTLSQTVGSWMDCANSKPSHVSRHTIARSTVGYGPLLDSCIRHFASPASSRSWVWNPNTCGSTPSIDLIGSSRSMLVSTICRITSISRFIEALRSTRIRYCSQPSASKSVLKYANSVFLCNCRFIEVHNVAA